MNQNRKLEIQERRIRFLEEKNTDLEKENRDLKSRLDSMLESVEWFQHDYVQLRDDLDDLKMIKRAYLQSSRDIIKIKKAYEMKMRAMLKNICK